MKRFDDEKIIQGVKYILEGLGENYSREGLQDTPKRVLNYYKEILEGQCYSNDDIAFMFNKQFSRDDINDDNSSELVLIGDIGFFSMCEHHLALIYDGIVKVAYIPKDRVIGLSKVNRIVKMVSKRLTLQERLTNDIFYIMKKVLETEDIAIFVKAKHGCITSRGIKDQNSYTITNKLGGNFKNDKDLRNEFLSLIKV